MTRELHLARPACVGKGRPAKSLLPLGEGQGEGWTKYLNQEQ